LNGEDKVDLTKRDASGGRSQPQKSQPLPKKFQTSEQARHTRLMRTVESEVIPRLLMAHRGLDGDAGAPVCDGAKLEAGAVPHLSGLVCRGQDRAQSYVDHLRDGGLSMESVYLNLLAPSARYLGDMWTEDLCSFAEVTTGLWSLQKVVHRLSPAFHNESQRRWLGLSVLLVPVPGEQHTLGLHLVAEFFRRAGWDTLSTPVGSTTELTRIVATQWFAVVGFSVGGDRQLDTLSKAIHEVRKTSQNRSVAIMAGGPAFVDQPELARRVGADATAPNGPLAASHAKDLVNMLG
jgi:methanogenic corrinoid protein MtbC1